MGYELEDLGKHAQAAARGQLIKVAKAKRDNPEDHLSAALNALLYGIEDPRQVGAYLIEPGVKIRGQGFHVPNERASKGEARRLKWVGVKSGVADWIFTGPPLRAIELKHGKNRATPNQVTWGVGLVYGWDQIGLTEDDMGGDGPSLENLRRAFAPRYHVCSTLADAVTVLWEADLIMEPDTLEEVGKAIEAVKLYWLLKYRREII